MYDFFSSLIYPFKLLVASIMVYAHQVLSVFGFEATSGWTWTLAIVIMVLVLRTAMIPLFVRSIRAQRAMQLIQPELQKLQAKYKGKNDQASREAMMKEQMELFQKHGTNPFSSCMPLLLQAPFFSGLFFMLNGIRNGETVGPLNLELVRQFDAATIFGSSLSATFTDPGQSTDVGTTKILTLALAIFMSITMFTTQRQLMMKNMPAAALEGPMAQTQKIMLYMMPVLMLFSGVTFPVGVLIYMVVNNMWTTGQQFWVIRNNPTPGTPAEAAYHARLRAAGKPIPGEAERLAAEAAERENNAQRVQPKKQSKSKRK